MSCSSTICILKTFPPPSVRKAFLNSSAIESILDKVGTRPFCIISINGKFRKGKSLMLNFFLQYLRACEAQQTNKPVNWFDPLSVGKDFNWRGGTEAETNGIHIYSEPFELTFNGQAVAILLMDTQGSFDDQTTVSDNAVIFAISALLSSVLIMNIEHDVTEDMLQFFQFFAGYAQYALQDESDERNHEDASAPFAKYLSFLVRDFQWVEDYNLGYHDDTTPGRNYKREKLNASADKSTEANFLREQIDEMFPRVSVNLLPHPGNQLASRSLLDRLDEDFVESVIGFVENSLKPENIIKKTFGGEILTGITLKPYIAKWKELFERHNPTVTNITEATAKVQNLMALENAEKHFDSKMREFFKANIEGVSDHEYVCKTNQLKEECFLVFKQTKKIGGKIYEDQYSSDLNKTLERKIEHHQILNMERVAVAVRTKKLEAERKELEHQFQISEQKFRDHKVKSEAELQNFQQKLSVVSESMNQAVKDKQVLQDKHHQLQLDLQSITNEAAKNRLHHENGIRELTAKIEQQQQTIHQLNIARQNAYDSDSSDDGCVIS